MSQLLIDLATAQGGVFSTADSRRVGVDANELRRLICVGEVLRVDPRAHVLASAMAGAATPEQRHRLETLAVLRAFDNRVAASHHSALALHGLPFWDVDESVIHVSRVTGRSGRVRGRLHIHESQTFLPLLKHSGRGELTTLPALAVVGTAIEDGVRAGVVAIDAAVQRKRTTLEDIADLIKAMRCVPGITRAHRALELADGLAESPAETLTRLILAAMPDLPQIVAQVPFEDASGHVWARGDFGIGPHFVLEVDGRKKYRAAEAATTAQAEDIVWREKQREDRIRTERRVVGRVVWADIMDPWRVHRIVREGLRQAAELYGPSALDRRRIVTSA